jgi:hypothetical protein
VRHLLVVAVKLLERRDVIALVRSFPTDRLGLRHGGGTRWRQAVSAGFGPTESTLTF